VKSSKSLPSLRSLQSLGPGALIGLIVGTVLVVGLAGWFLLVRPQGAKVKDLKTQAAEVQSKIDAYRQQVAAARAVPKIEVADVYRLAKAMPDRTDMPDLVLELSQLARDTGIRFDSITPQQAAPIGSYMVLPISVTFQGNFYNVADFLYRLRSLVSVHAGRLDATGRLFSVDTLTFNESTLKFPQIQATLAIDAFVYGTGAPAPAPIPTTPTTTPPATTTTTATAATATTTTPTTPEASSSASATGAP
jgi:type IV pilus assembly protein PilO